MTDLRSIKLDRQLSELPNATNLEQVLSLINQYISTGGGGGGTATITVGNTDTLNAGQPATVTNSGTEFAVVLNFGIPKGDKGDKGDAGTNGTNGTNAVNPNFTIGNVVSGLVPKVTVTGVYPNLVLNFELVNGIDGYDGKSAYEIAVEFGGFVGNEQQWLDSLKGEKGDPGQNGTNADNPAFTIGDVTSGAEPKVTIGGAYPNYSLSFELQQGQQGVPGQNATNPNFTIGDVVSGASPNVTFSGTYPNLAFNFTLQKGDKGDAGNDGVSPPTPNFTASAVNGATTGVNLTGTYPNQAFEFTIGSSGSNTIILQDGVTGADLSPAISKIRIFGSTQSITGGAANIIVPDPAVKFYVGGSAPLYSGAKIELEGSQIRGTVGTFSGEQRLFLNIGDNTITTPLLRDLNVTTAKLADGAVTRTKLDSIVLDEIKYDQAVMTWTGNQAIANGVSFNLCTLLTNALITRNTIGLVLNETTDLFTLTARPFDQNIRVICRLTGTIGGSAGTAREFFVDFTRPGVGGALLIRDSVIKINDSTINSRQTSFDTYVVGGTTDLFFTQGFEIKINNTSTQNITLTGFTLLFFG